MPVPYLGGELKKGETEKKGRFDYAAWAVICNKLNNENERWQPGIRFNPDGLPYHICGNTAAVLIYFKEYETGKETPDWFYPITNNQNKPIPLDHLTCWDINNAHKRGLCSAAAGFFSLGYELWAKEELADMEVETLPPVNNVLNSNTSPTKTKQQPLNSDVMPEALTKQKRDLVITTLKDFKKDKPEKFKSFAFAFKANYHIPQNVENFADHIQEPKHAEWIEMFLRSLGE
jgi:hypothetical protein